MKGFVVHGPHPVPLEPNKTGKMVAQDLSEFWQRLDGVRYQRGVYVFAIRAGKGFTPIYVGKAAKQSFEAEVFSSHKLSKHYNPALLDYKRGSPVIFLIAHPHTKGTVSPAKLIDEVETFLINVASSKNIYLSNEKKRNPPEWRIAGVIRAQRGESTAATRAFRQAVGLK